jgi:transcriptional regulator with PAS, ATPase and Fis domain
MQVDLLRVLQEKKFHRLGNPEPVGVDFRLVSATHQDLQKAVEQKTFRRDFYYRINVITITVPPLRERKEDIPLLAEYFLNRYARETNKRFSGISKEAMKRLVEYDWPGNVRELENVIERAVVLAKKEKIHPEQLPFGEPGQARPLGECSLDAVTRDHIADVLERTEWNFSRAAEILGLNRSTLYKKVEKFNLKRPSDKSGR